MNTDGRFGKVTFNIKACDTREGYEETRKVCHKLFGARYHESMQPRRGLIECSGHSPYFDELEPHEPTPVYNVHVKVHDDYKLTVERIVQ